MKRARIVALSLAVTFAACGKDLSERTVDELEILVMRGDAEARIEAVKALAEHGSEAKKGLAAALNDSDARVRKAAAEGLHVVGKRAVPNLVAALTDEEAAVVEAASDSLAKIGEPALESLHRSLLTTSGTARAASLRGLIAIGHTSIPFLCQTLKALDPAAKLKALAGLAELLPGSEPAAETLAALREAAADKDEKVAAAARDLLSRLDSAD